MKNTILLGLALSGALALAAWSASERGIRQVRLSWTDDPRTTVTVTWQTDDPATKSYVSYRQARQSRAQRVEGTSVTYQYGTGTIRHAQLTGLKPSATYAYQVIGNEREGGTSETRVFRTAPDRDTPFTFTAYGDQGVSEDSKLMVQRVVSENAAFHLHLGDLSYANTADRGKVWDDWLEIITPLASRVAYMPSLGNHENEKLTTASPNTERVGYVAYLARFALPKPETRYTFDYAGARFIAPNSDDFKNKEQMVWLREALRAARSDPKVRWVIVFQHHPPYSSNVRRENNKPLIAAWEPLLDEFKVDLVLAGHNHNYERTLPMRDGQATHTDAKTSARGAGTVYVISGGGGKGLYDFVPEKPVWCAAREKTHNFLRIKVDGQALTVTALRRDGSTIEQFAIEAR